MKAIQVKEYVSGPLDLRVTDLPDPTPSPDQYLIAVKACATMSSEHSNEKSEALPLGADVRDQDVESQTHIDGKVTEEDEVSPIKGLCWLDRLLALWILLTMIIGILLGNFVASVGPALHQGEFVGVSIPIGA